MGANLPAEYVMSLRFKTAATGSLEGDGGTRVAVGVTGGDFDGPRLRGDIVSGSDWAFRRTSGVLEVDVRAQLRADDGVVLLLSYLGLGWAKEPSGTRVLANVRFEAPRTSAYAWLNDEVCVAAGWATPGAVTYDVYALREPTPAPTAGA
ncbi:DUF3237 domain-containing protein [Mycolicibacterium sp. P9-22]|uniref:DUF3237 domain-containing protein n=1 Tax=Mycolicibacterium sp. P9-22 TaxID=2024613 RepID=UPI0011EE18BB|nr:DUF3237 domain-containing protein [Mycolicibacterium sp. P9-22]KAA0120621.1 DUF3237 domain-containing protein [Mycolicibacterium sp. P9-22]